MLFIHHAYFFFPEHSGRGIQFDEGNLPENHWRERRGPFWDPFKDFTLKGSESHWAVLGNILFLSIEPVWRYHFWAGFRIGSPLVDTWTTALAIKRTFHNLHSFAITVGGQVVVYPHGCERTYRGGMEGCLLYILEDCLCNRKFYWSPLQ